MAQLLEEGFWPCIVLSGEAGDVDGIAKTRINVRFAEGPNAGRVGYYEDKVDARSALYVSRSMRAVGWQGNKLSTFAEDVAAWIKATGGKSTAEVKHIPTKKGTIWDKINSIGRGPKPMTQLQGDTLADAEEALRKAMAEDGDTNGAPPPDDVPHAGVSDDEIPFLTASAHASLGEIAKVLR